jgi:WD40 repeat protein/energy-coupling factor transporter ATP-binding protein EcfA2
MNADLPAGASPYPGLRPFEAHEAHLFFGRDEQIDELLRRLSRHRFLAIVGTSGCGKSSLVRAGLLPNLRGGGMAAAGSSWHIATLRPGADPIGSLAAALNALDVFGGGADDEGDLPATAFTEAALRRGPLGLVDVVRQLRLAAGENLLVLVDQFEEIFRFAPVAGAKGRDDAAAFVKLLLEAAGQQEHRIFIVLTMRSDFLGDCARLRGLPEAINEGQYLVPRLTRGQLREAIEGPAAVAGGAVSPTLVQALLAEAADHDLLPLLQHALMRTWTLGQGAPVLDLPAYEATGGIAHALSRHADEAYEELAPREQRMAKRLFQRLTQGRASGRGTRRPSRLSEIRDVVDAPLEDVVRIIGVFRRPDRAFLMPPEGVPLGPDSTIDISHESLMRQWVRLREWTREEYESSTEYRRLSEAAALHADGKAGLWREPELDIALAWKAEQRPTAAWATRYQAGFEQAMAFLDESAARRRLRRRSVAIALAAVAFLIVGAVAFLAGERGAQNSLRVQLASSVADPATRALLLAELGDVAEPDHLPLYEAAAAAAIPLAVFGGRAGEMPIGSVFTDGGRRVATLSRNGAIGWRGADGRGPPDDGAMRASENGGGRTGSLELRGMSATHDGERIAAFTERTIYLAATADGVAMAIPVEGGSPLTAMALAADGSRIAGALLNGSIRIWDLAGSTSVLRDLTVSGAEPGGVDPVEHLHFDAAGTVLAIGTSTGVVRVLHVDDSTRDAAPEAGGGCDSASTAATLTSLALSPDGNWLACGYSDNVVRVSNSRTPGPPLLLPGHQAPVLALAFNPVSNSAGLTLATASEDGTARLWTLQGGGRPGSAAPALAIRGAPVVLSGHAGRISDIAFAADGGRVATTADDGVRVWRTRPLEPLVLGEHAGEGRGNEIETVAFSPDGRFVVSASRDGTARVWKIDGSGLAVTLDRHTDWVRGALFSPADPSTVVTISEDRTLLVWSLSAVATERQRLALKNRPLSLAFSPDGTRVAVGSTASVEVLRLADLKVETALPDGPDRWVFDVAFSDDGSRVAAARDRTAAVWRPSAGGEPTTVGGEDAARVLAVAFSPDGSRLATGSAGNTARIWTLPEAAPEPWEVRHGAEVNDVALGTDAARDRRWLLTASSDRTVRLTDAGTGREVLSFEHPAAVRAARFDPAGGRIVTGADDGVIRLWRHDLGRLVAVLREATTACLAPSERVAFLGESPSRAEAEHGACERRSGREGP